MLWFKKRQQRAARATIKAVHQTVVPLQPSPGHMRLLIVDDHPLFSSGLRLLLQQAIEGLSAVECAKSGQEALAHLHRQPFELMLMDWKLGEGLAGAELIAQSVQACPDLRVVVVSAYGSPRVVREAIDAGASGFVSKDCTAPQLLQSLSTVIAGGIHLPALALDGEAPDSLFPQAGDGAGPSSPASRSGAKSWDVREAFPTLTTRHVQVLSRVVSGMSNKQIARLLGITDGTVKQHVNAIFREIGVTNRTEAVYLLARMGVRFR